MPSATAEGGLTPDSHTQACHTVRVLSCGRQTLRTLSPGIQHGIFLEVFPREKYIHLKGGAFFQTPSSRKAFKHSLLFLNVFSV